MINILDRAMHRERLESLTDALDAIDPTYDARTTPRVMRGAR